MNAPRTLPPDVRVLVDAESTSSDDPAGTAGEMSRLCRAARRVLDVSGVGVTVTTDEGPTTSVACTDLVTRDVVDLQFSLGEGPSWDAYTGRRPTLAPDLLDGAVLRWPALVPAVRRLGVAALFAFPLQVGHARVGSLDLSRTSPGPLSRAQVALALDFADLATAALLDGQHRAASGSAADGLAGALQNRAQLHQAQGMVMVQLDVEVAEAMVRIRAHAYATELPLDHVAAAIVARRLVLEEDVH